MYFNKFSKLNTTHFSGEALLLHVTNLLVDVVPLLPLVRLKNISLKINCELEVGQRLPTHHLSSTSVPAPNEFISFFDDEVIIIHPCCKYHQRRFKTIPICHISVAIVHKFHPLKEKLRQSNAWLARFDRRRLPLLTGQGKESCFL